MASKLPSSNPTSPRGGNVESAHVHSGRIEPDRPRSRVSREDAHTRAETDESSREVKARRSSSDGAAGRQREASGSEAGHTGEHLRAAREHMSAAARSAIAGFGEARHAAGEALRSGFADARPEFAAASGEVRAAGGAAMADAGAQWQRVRDSGSAMLARSEDFVRERPLTAVGIAVASGFVLSRLLSR
jgi:ElaB/YqjD/DUF883 family membrane-anchored ribosome-binding protein